MLENLFMFLAVTNSLLVSFFKNGVWVIGFFYLLNKTFRNEKLKKASLFTFIVVIIIMLLYVVVDNLSKLDFS